MTATRVERDSLGPVNIAADKLWGAQTQRSLEHFSIGDDLIPREMMVTGSNIQIWRIQMGRNVADVLWEMLQKAGVKRCYGIVGDALNPVIDALRRNGNVDCSCAE